MTQNLWIIFCIIFLGLSLFHFYLSRKKIKTFESKAKIKSFNGMNLGIAEFIEDFNNYVEKQNEQNKRINIATSVGYLAAFLTSVYSYYLSCIL